MKANDALAAAFEVANKPVDGRSAMRLFTVMLLALFFVALMGGLASGIGVYGSVMDARSRVGDVHMRAGMLSNVVRMNDAADAVERGEGPEGPSLVLVQRLETGTYQTRVYAYRGMVVQEYAIAGADYNPERATALFASSSFDFQMEGSLLRIYTDGGQTDVALRSDQGGPR